MATVTTHPYELLVRWDSDGNLQGAHVGWRDVVMEGAVKVSEAVRPVEPVDIGQGKGFPLADILSLVQAATLAANARLTAEKAALEAERDEAIAAKLAAQAERDALLNN